MLTRWRPAGEHVFRHNEVCSTLHICVKGKVAMVTPERVLHAVHRTGDHFGADALITNQPRAHDAVVLANSDIMSLSATALMKNMRKCSESSAAIRSNALELCAPCKPRNVSSQCCGARRGQLDVRAMQALQRPHDRRHAAARARRLGDAAPQGLSRRAAPREPAAVG